MQESEKLLEKKLGLGVKALGGWSIKLPTLHVAGLPDRLCLLPGGRLFFAEIKTTGEAPSKIQLWVHRKLLGMGFTVEVLDNSAQIQRLLRTYEND